MGNMVSLYIAGLKSSLLEPGGIFGKLDQFRYVKSSYTSTIHNHSWVFSNVYKALLVTSPAKLTLTII